VFDTLSDRLQGALGDLGKRGKLDDEAISKAMREIRLALLEADVNFQVVKDFVAHVRERATGQDVLKSLTPGQQVVKIVHDELTELMGSSDSKLAFGGKGPTVILLAGLQGSGKTTLAGKLALLLRKEGKKPGLVAADLQRPAAIDQLEQLGKQIQIPVYREDTTDPVKAVRTGLDRARAEGRDVVIVDTAGRLQTQKNLMAELTKIQEAIRKQIPAAPHEVILVLDATTGQNGISQAAKFTEAVDCTGIVLAKLDGTAKGGVVVAIRQQVGLPVKYIGVGEKSEDLSLFVPDQFVDALFDEVTGESTSSA
jgi:signal recognition particle subunit SRP54